MNTITAAIQFGSYRICAAAAICRDNGKREVCALESAPTNGCIKHGCVSNIEETAQIIKSLMLKLSNKVASKGYGNLTSAYVGMCGISMHSMRFQPTTLASPDNIITGEIKKQLEQACRNLNLPDRDILGIKCNSIRQEESQVMADYQLIVAESRLRMGIEQAMERAQIRVAGFFATPLTTADILTTEEKQLGCALIDMGAHLTTLSLYRDNELKYLMVIPLGSEAVTTDIATLNLRQGEAENMKQNWSDVSSICNNAATGASSACPVNNKELNFIVTSRYEEIAANVAMQIDKAGLKNQLEGGCILTGGASMQKGLTTLMGHRLEINRICTRSCNTVSFSSSERKPHLASLMSMLPYCTASCEEKKVEVKVPVPQTDTPPETSDNNVGGRSRAANSGRISRGVSSFFGDLFSGLDS